MGIGDLVQGMDYFWDEKLKNKIYEEDKLDQKEQMITKYQNIFGDVYLCVSK